MNDINMGQMTTCTLILLALFCPVLLFYLVAKHKLNKSRFFRFLGVLGIGILSCTVPWGPFGVIMGFPSVLVNSILVSLFLDKE
jgi:hypothetical protein